MALISCVIAVYNGADYIQAAIESVLGQSMPIDQIIVVDDGSEDRTCDIVDTFSDQLTFLKKPHSGVADTLNHGLLQVTGDVVTFLDADDLWHADKTKLQYAWLDAHPEYDAVFCHAQEFVSPELSDEEKSELPVRNASLRGMSKTAMMIRKTYFDKVGMFSVEDNMGDFIEWFTRAQALDFRHHMLDDVLMYRRIHLNNFTRTQRRQIANYAQILRRSLELKRMKSQE